MGRATVPTPDMEGRIVVMTGANSGIGREAAVALAAMGATVVMGSRNATKGEQALADVRWRSGSEHLELLPLDLASFASIRSFAKAFRARHDRLHVLCNNAGGMLSERTETVDGFETTFGVNHLGHFLLTDELLPLLRAGAPSRIVNTASVAHHWAVGGLDFEDLQSRRWYLSWRAYGRSKLANILHVRELARRLEGSGVTANALHPGAVRTQFGGADDTAGIDRLGIVLGRPFMISPQAGARTIVHLASSPAVADQSGGYWVRNHRRRGSGRSRRPVDATRLWDESEKLVASVPVAPPPDALDR